MPTPRRRPVSLTKRPGGGQAAARDAVDEARDPADASPTNGPPRSGTWRRRLALAGTTLLVLGILTAAAAFGWLLRGWLPSGDVGTTTVVVKRPVQIQAAAVSAGTLPNVLGLGVDEARQAYADAGAEAALIVEHAVPYVAQERTVVEQKPAAASPIKKNATKLELVVAVPARMPDIVGLSSDAARAKLAAIGVGATTIVRSETSVDPGEVARSRPAAGQPARPRATIVVSEAPSSVTLADVEPIENSCALDAGDLRCDVTQSGSQVAYAINDRVSGFSGNLVLDDTAPQGARVRLTVRAGSRVIGTYTAGRAARDIDLRITGGTRLALELRRLDSGVDSAQVLLRDGEITGARSGIDKLATP